jgi:hypothetical protein
MPNITQFTSPIDKLQPSEIGPEAVARAAAVQTRSAVRMGVLGEQLAQSRRESARAQAEGIRAIGHGQEVIGQGLNQLQKTVEDFEAHREIGLFGSALMKTQEQLDTDWNQTRGKADPNIPVGSDWREKKMVPALDKLVEDMRNPKARELAQNQVDAAKRHYFATTEANDKAAAGDGALRNLQTVVEGATIRSSKDFSTMQYNSDLIKTTGENIIQTGNLGPNEARLVRDHIDKWQHENVVAGWKGAIDRNPGGALAQLQKVGDNSGISAKDIQTLEHYGKEVQRAHRSDALNAQMSADIATRKQSEALLQKTLNGLTNLDDPSMWNKLGQGALTQKGLTSEDRIRLLNLSHSRAKELEDTATGKITRPNPMAEFDLNKRINDPTNPLTKNDIDDAVRSPDLSKRITADQGIKLYQKLDQLTKADAKPEDKEWHEAKTATGNELKAAVADIMPSGSAIMASAAIARMQQYFDAKRQEGVPKEKLLDPTSPDWYMNDPGLRKILKDKKAYEMKTILEKGGPSAPSKPVGPLPDPFAGLK